VVSFDGTDIPLDHFLFRTPEIRVHDWHQPDGGRYLGTICKTPHLLLGPYACAEDVDIRPSARPLAANPTPPRIS
jgi:hypothetical protein